MLSGMPGEATSGAAAFRQAFEAYVGRPPTIEESKDALLFMGIVEKTGLDPFLLSHIVDVKNREQRDRLPAEIAGIITAGLGEIREAIPSGSELASRLQGIQAFRAAMASAQKTIEGATNFLSARVLPLVAAVAIVVALILGTFAFCLWRAGYGAGFANRSSEQGCAILGNLYGHADRDRDG